MAKITSNTLQPEKILGILWEVAGDILVFDFSEICKTYKTLNITKRNVLKILAMLYDPIGLLQPILINLKRMLQEICKQKLSWDELLPDDFRNEFEKIMFSFQDMEKISIVINTLLQSDRNRITWFQRFKFAKLWCLCLFQDSFKIRSFQCTFGSFKVKTRSDKKHDNTKMGITRKCFVERLMASVKSTHSKVIKFLVTFTRPIRWLL